MENKMTLKYSNFDDALYYFVKKFADDCGSACLISDIDNIKYATEELLSCDGVTIDEIYLLESEYDFLIGLDDDLNLFVDDLEDSPYLFYKTVFIDVDSVDDADAIIKVCEDNGIEVVRLSKFDLEELEKEIEEDTKSIDIIIDDKDKNTKIHLYDSDGLDFEKILSVIDEIFR